MSLSALFLVVAAVTTGIVATATVAVASVAAASVAAGDPTVNTRACGACVR